jgi:hypothetical protein
MEFSGFLHFCLHLQAVVTLPTMTLHAFSRWAFNHVAS